MEAVEFKAKINNHGFNFASFARFVGVNRSTIIRYCQGAITPIPNVYCQILLWLDEGKLQKPEVKKQKKTIKNKDG